MIPEPARVRLELASRPENAALVRAALGGVAAAVGLAPEFLGDLKTAVSEACNNVILHAYGDHSGLLLVDVAVFGDGISVTVVDNGTGITETAAGEEHMGLGLAVIRALADQADFLTPEVGGTEVRMWFAEELVMAPALAPVDRPDWSRGQPVQLAGDVVAWFSPVALARPVLDCVFRAMAASAHFPVDRIPQLSVVNDAIAGYIEVAADGDVGVALSSSPRRLALTGGPLCLWGNAGMSADERRHHSAQLVHRREVLEDAVDTLSTERLAEAEMLHLALVNRRLRVV